MRKTKFIVDHELEASVIGLVSTLKDYKLAWNINQVFKIDLFMQPELRIELVKDTDLSITNYLYSTEFQQIRLIKNKSNEANSGYLIPELVNFDFFIMISGENDLSSDDPVFDKMHTIKGINYFQLIDVSKLKSKDNFIF
ncbi:MAG: IPExxxVDY family protein [Bacteroidetes bacterium]|nr:MAG: IPExxxVDY family protein [Bacteroidota bacterium]